VGRAVTRILALIVLALLLAGAALVACSGGDSSGSRTGEPDATADSGYFADAPNADAQRGPAASGSV